MIHSGAPAQGSGDGSRSAPLSYERSDLSLSPDMWGQWKYAGQYYFIYILRTIYSICLYLVIVKYRVFLDFIDVYFTLKSLYIVSLGGRLIWGHNFLNKDSAEKYYNDEKILLAGLLYAFTRGVNEVENIGGNIELVKKGDTYFFFAFGKNIFGILFSTQNHIILKNKLDLFIQEVENIDNGNKFENWDGEVTAFLLPDNELISLLDKIFR